MVENSVSEKLGIAIIGFGGAVATTAVAGVTLIKKGLQDTSGLPLADMTGLDLKPYKNIIFRGWDIYEVNLYEAAKKHDVLENAQLEGIKDELAQIKPWRAISSKAFCSGVTDGKVSNSNLRGQVKTIQDDLQSFGSEINAPIVVINLASTEHAIDVSDNIFLNIKNFETALDNDSDKISPAMVYAYAAIDLGIAYANFTPSMAVDIPALIEFSKIKQVPVAGKDGKTGQTLIKTIVAPALKARALRVDGWFSTNILGNRDGQALDKPESLQSKINTKGSVLDSCLDYKVENHIVHIHYYKPRGDNKEAWDNIDLSGFLGHKMQLKINFLCKDSILAAPLVIEIARCLDLAQVRGEFGPLESLGVFFKAPLTYDGGEPEHKFYDQDINLLKWLKKPNAQKNGNLNRKNMAAEMVSS